MQYLCYMIYKCSIKSILFLNSDFSLISNITFEYSSLESLVLN